MAVNRARMEAQITLHEGNCLRPYKDSLGLWTVGRGYCIQNRGVAFLESAIGRRWRGMDDQLTEEESLKLLRADLDRLEAGIPKKLPEWNQLDEVRQRAVLDFVFNMENRALGFKTAIARLRLALKQTDPDLRQACWDAVAFHMVDSLWARQVGDGLGGRIDRADRLAAMMRTGQDWQVAA